MDLTLVENSLGELLGCEKFIKTRKKEFDALETDMMQFKKDKEFCETTAILIEEGQVVVRKIMGWLAERGVRALEKMLEDGLNMVFLDSQCQVKIELDDKRDYKVMNTLLLEGDLTCNIKDSVGEGVKSVISLLYQIYYIVNSGGLRFLLLDECLSTIHPDEMENLFRLFKVFHDKLGFNFLLVTHTKKVIKLADAVYRIENGNLKLIDSV